MAPFSPDSINGYNSYRMSFSYEEVMKMGIRAKHKIILYIIISIILGLIFSWGFAFWVAGESGNLTDMFLLFLPWGIILGFFFGIFAYCYVASEASL
jgi:hypothetical protein